MINPLHSVLPGQVAPSPYNPSSRVSIDPAYLAPDLIDPAVDRPPALAGAGLSGDGPGEFVDRTRSDPQRTAALRSLWNADVDRAEFDAWERRRDPLVEAFATFAVLVDHHGTDCSRWPDGLGHAADHAVATFAAVHRDEVDVQSWLQWQCDRQLSTVACHIGLIVDVAVGIGSGGADQWMWPDCFADGASIGAPPDEFNTSGQNWGLPPLDPWRLRAQGYEPFVQAVRSACRRAAGIRIDHIMGLMRLWWIPTETADADGCYVSYPWRDLVGIVALEATRAGTFVVGEDLGTVDEGFRTALAAAGILSYKVLWFESEEPATWPAQSLASVTTHDLPTIVGLWTGRDLERQRELGLEPNEAGEQAIRRGLAERIVVAADAPVSDVVVATSALLASAGSAVSLVAVDDLDLAPERPNYPSTVGPHNWSGRLRNSVDELVASPVALATASAFAFAGGTGCSSPGESPS